MKKSFNFLDR